MLITNVIDFIIYRYNIIMLVHYYIYSWPFFNITYYVCTYVRVYNVNFSYLNRTLDSFNYLF